MRAARAGGARARAVDADGVRQLRALGERAGGWPATACARVSDLGCLRVRHRATLAAIATIGWKREDHHAVGVGRTLGRPGVDVVRRRRGRRRSRLWERRDLELGPVATAAIVPVRPAGADRGRQASAPFRRARASELAGHRRCRRASGRAGPGRLARMAATRRERAGDERHERTSSSGHPRLHEINLSRGAAVRETPGARVRTEESLGARMRIELPNRRTSLRT